MFLTIMNIIFWSLSFLFGLAIAGGIFLSISMKSYKYTFLFLLIFTGLLVFLTHRNEIISWLINVFPKLL